MSEDLDNKIKMILKFTSNIKKIYDRLCTYEIMSILGISNNYAVSHSINILKEFISYENDAYECLMDDDVYEVLDYVSDEDNCEFDFSFRNRIKNYLSKKLLREVVQLEDDEVIDEYLTSEFFTYMTITRKFTRDEMIIFVLQVLPVLNNSLFKHFMISLDDEIKKDMIYKQKKDFINLRYKMMFEKGKDLELDVINNNINGNVEKELLFPNVNKGLKDELIAFEVVNKLYNIMVVLASSVEEDMILEELIWFKTYIVYLDEDMLNYVNDYINNLNFQNESIKNKLLDYLKNIKYLRNIHNGNSKNIQK